MPPTMHSATQTVRYRSKNPIAGRAPPIAVSVLLIGFLSGLLSDRAHFTLDRVAVKHMQRQIHELAYAVHDLPVDLAEYLAFFVVAAFESSRIFKAPMRRHRFARPDRADFARCLIADRDNEIHVRSVERRELIPALAAQFRRVIAERFASLGRERINGAGRMAAGTVRAESAFPQNVEQRFGHDAARAVARAKNEDRIGFVAHARLRRVTMDSAGEH